jgi:hypothetical protein
VVTDDPADAGALAAEEPESVDGAEGAVVMRSDAQHLANAVIDEFGPALGVSGLNALGAQLFTDSFEVLSGSLSASTDGVRGQLRLTFE